MCYVKACCQIEVMKFSENPMEWIVFNIKIINKVEANLIKWKVNWPKFGERCTI